MDLDLFDYDLPEHFIAQTPAEPRDASRLMTLRRSDGAVGHHTFRDIEHMLHPGDVLVLNDTRVIPARLVAHKDDSGGKMEILLLRQITNTDWLALIGGRGAYPGRTLRLPNHEITATVLEELEESQRLIRFSQPINGLLEGLGELPLPPYIHQRAAPSERYQTVYSQRAGSAAAPTAGLHFTPELLLGIRERGVHLAYCTLHVGLDTFKPVKVQRIEDHTIHSEWASLSPENANIINQAVLGGGRVIAVGSTSTRTLETAAILSAGGDPANPHTLTDICAWRPVIAFESDTALYIYPGYRWRVVSGIITNFHLPRSSLLMMMSAFTGREALLSAYETAKRSGYRFFSFGDAMFIS
jgi:S-adenosylmethionine:tRNA ribosyltransferase-isomerase